jgi:hypothetical protein
MSFLHQHTNLIILLYRNNRQDPHGTEGSTKQSDALILKYVSDQATIGNVEVKAVDKEKQYNILAEDLTKIAIMSKDTIDCNNL